MKSDRDNSIAIICYTIMACLTELAIAHGDNTLYPEWLRRVYLYGIFLCLCLAITVILPNINKRLKGICFVPLLFFAFNTFHSRVGISGAEVFDLVYSSIRLGGFLCLAYCGQVKVYEWFKRFLVVMSFFGIIAFFAYVLSLPIHYRAVDFYVDDAYADYVDYGFGILFREFGAIRLCGLFNEPGAFGTILALVLCAERYNMKDKKNIILLIAAVLTFSVAFFLITAVHFILRIIKKPILIFPVILGGVLLIVVLLKVFSGNPIVDAFVSRFVFEDGVIDNRTSAFVDKTFLEVIGGSNFLLGFGRGYLSTTGYEGSSSSIKTVIIDHGILGFIMLYGTLLLVALKRARGNKAAVNLIICFFLSIYQRPIVYTLAYFVILFGGIHYILERKNDYLFGKIPIQRDSRKFISDNT